MGFHLDFAGYISYGKTFMDWLATQQLAQEINVLIYLVSGAIIVRIFYNNLNGNKE
jgi:hypothetical protein